MEIALQGTEKAAEGHPLPAFRNLDIEDVSFPVRCSGICMQVQEASRWEYANLSRIESDNLDYGIAPLKFVGHSRFVRPVKKF